MKHTKGPWRLEDNGANTRIETIEGKAIGAAWECDDDFANAHLMAAAPELYELLSKINTAFYTRASKAEWMELMEHTKPLLQKARGESK